MTTLSAHPVHIAGIGVVSPLGVGFGAFRTHWRSGLPPALAADRGFAGPRLPAGPAAVLNGFDARDYLGKKGVASLDRTTQLAIVASGLALEHAGIRVTPDNERELGMVLGTAMGGIKSIADFTQSTYTNDPPYTVSAMHFPNTVMNCAAGQCAIWHKLKGINSTLCAGHLSSLLALRYASLMLRLGNARTLLAGGVEEYCDFAAWSHQAMRGGQRESPPGEGCALFALTTDPELPRLATLLSCEVVTCQPLAQRESSFHAAMQSCLARALGRAGLPGSDIEWFAPQGTQSDPLGAIEHACVSRIAGRGARAIETAALSGETYSACASFQLAAALASQHRGVGVVTAATSSGMVGCALVRLEAARA